MGVSPAFSLLDRLPLRAWDRLVFVECGDGRLAEEAWRRVTKGYVCALDRSPEVVDLGWWLRGVPGKLDFKTWDGQRLPCPHRTFDHVVCTVAWLRCRDRGAATRVVSRGVRGRSHLPHPRGTPSSST